MPVQSRMRRSFAVTALPNFFSARRRLNLFVPYQLLADTVLVLHVALVAFVVGGLIAIVIGKLRQWRWTDALWFRLAHLACIAVVAAQAWLGLVCPLTTLEMWLRAQAQLGTYSGSFIEHWLQHVLYYNAPEWAFTLVYSLYGLAVLATWWFAPPRRASRGAPAAV